MAQNAFGISVSQLKARLRDNPIGAFAFYGPEELLKQFDITVDKRKIQLSDAIKTFGTHTVDVKLHTEVMGKINVLIAEDK